MNNYPLFIKTVEDVKNQWLVSVIEIRKGV